MRTLPRKNPGGERFAVLYTHTLSNSSPLPRACVSSIFPPLGNVFDPYTHDNNYPFTPSRSMCAPCILFKFPYKYTSVVIAYSAASGYPLLEKQCIILKTLIISLLNNPPPPPANRVCSIHIYILRIQCVQRVCVYGTLRK